MKKVIRITMPDGSEWDVPAELVAEHRANYYAKSDTGETIGPAYLKVYEKELKFALANHDDLIDWAANNMDWKDVKADATMHKAGCVDYQEGWVNGDKRVIEVV